MNKKKLLPYSFICIVLIGMIISFLNKMGKKEDVRETITIGIPENPYIQNLDTNYYILWLEEKSGYNLNFVILPSTHTREYIDNMFTSGNIKVDAIFSFPCDGEFYLANTTLQSYGEEGFIIPLNKYIETSPNMQRLFEDFSEYNFKKAITASDGNIYYVPGMDTSIRKRYPQILWINQRWLRNLNLSIPSTVEELEIVLEAFKNRDPNGNELKDEIPLAGCQEFYGEQSYNFIINSYIYNDPKNSRMIVKDGQVDFAPLTHQWREAVQKLYDLYNEDLLHSFQFTLNKQQLIQLANDPRDLLGAFTSADITDVLLQSSPEIISDYVRVPPLKESDSTPFSMINTPLPIPNGVITSSCQNPEAVFKLFELMLSEEAFLIGRYGEEDTDWEYASPGDIDMQGNKAMIRIKNQLRNKVQNKHILETGPYLSYDKYSNSITWNGFQTDQEYMNARAYEIYSNYKPKEYIKTILFEGENAENLYKIRSEIDDYTNKMLQRFITGSLNPYNDMDWHAYTKFYYTLKIEELISAVQGSYDSLLNK